MIKKQSIYIDTDVSGTVVQASHSLDGFAYPFFYELDNSHKVFLSLDDPRIAEYKVLDNSTIQVSFASTFKGFLDIIVLDVDEPTNRQRLLNTEKRLDQMAQTQASLVTSAQFKQMSTYIESQIKKLEGNLQDLTSLYNNLQNDMNNL